LREIVRRDEEKLLEKDFEKLYPCGLGVKLQSICRHPIMLLSRKNIQNI